MPENDTTPEPETPGADPAGELDAALMSEPPHPINWNLLTADEAEAEWLELNRWVNWLRTTYGLPASVVPPFWHRHSELVWELSALHLHWLAAYDPEQNASARWAGTATSRTPASGSAIGSPPPAPAWTATVLPGRPHGRARSPPSRSRRRSSKTAMRTSWRGCSRTLPHGARQRTSSTPASTRAPGSCGTDGRLRQEDGPPAL